jgi:ADP-ribose pyrophosphatase YjhB (NUDIX family)
VSRSLRVGAYAVCLRDGAVLLARLTGDPPRWTLPGGGLDHGEDPRDGAVREVEEETGYRVELRQLLTVESFRWLLDRPDGLVDHQAICIIYTAEVVGGELRHEVGGSTDVAAWVALEDVPDLVRNGLVDIGLAVAGYLPASGDTTVG